jgi:hypothetical protein
VRSLLDPYSDIRSINIRETSEEFPFYHHISASELKTIFEERGWSWGEYKKFAVVRNPFDRVVSLWYHHQWMIKVGHTTTPINSFGEYVGQIDVKNRLSTSLQNLICDEKNKELVNNIFQFEKLELQLPSFLRSINSQIETPDIPRLNSSENRKDYRSYYNDHLKQRVSDLFADEIAQFSYVF